MGLLEQGRGQKMAELILTDEEKEIALWKDLDDATVGKLCKVGLATIDDVDKERDHIQGFSAALLFVMKAVEANATSYAQTLNGLTNKGQPMGDWEIMCERIDESGKKEDGISRRKVFKKLEILDQFLNTIQKIEWHATLNCNFRRQVKQLLHETQEELSNLQFDREGTKTT
jgi:hypothetical protein